MSSIRPDYYRVKLSNGTEIECFELIDALGLDFYLGNVLKYVFRSGRSGRPRAQDLKKAASYAVIAAKIAEQELKEQE